MSDELHARLESAERELTRLKSGAINHDFVQVSRKHIDALNALAMASPSAHKLLWTLVKAMNKQNSVMVSQDSLQKLTGLSRPTVQRATALLREQQWIDCLKVGTANVYRVNSSVVWQSRADQKWATFNAAVLLNFDEQDAITKDNPEPKLRHIPFVEAGNDVIVPDAKSIEPPPDQPQLDFYE